MFATVTASGLQSRTGPAWARRMLARAQEEGLAGPRIGRAAEEGHGQREARRAMGSACSSRSTEWAYSAVKMIDAAAWQR